MKHTVTRPLACDSGMFVHVQDASNTNVSWAIEPSS